MAEPDYTLTHIFTWAEGQTVVAYYEDFQGSEVYFFDANSNYQLDEGDLRIDRYVDETTGDEKHVLKKVIQGDENIKKFGGETSRAFRRAQRQRSQISGQGGDIKIERRASAWEDILPFDIGKKTRIADLEIQGDIEVKERASTLQDILSPALLGSIGLVDGDPVDVSYDDTDYTITHVDLKEGHRPPPPETVKIPSQYPEETGFLGGLAGSLHYLGGSWRKGLEGVIGLHFKNGDKLKFHLRGETYDPEGEDFIGVSAAGLFASYDVNLGGFKNRPRHFYLTLQGGAYTVLGKENVVPSTALGIGLMSTDQDHGVSFYLSAQLRGDLDDGNLYVGGGLLGGMLF